MRASVFITSVWTWEPWSNGLMPAREPLLVDVDEQLEAELRGHAVAERDHLAELPGRVDVQQRERRLAGWNAFSARCSITALSLPIE